MACFLVLFVFIFALMSAIVEAYILSTGDSVDLVHYDFCGLVTYYSWGETAEKEAGLRDIHITALSEMSSTPTVRDKIVQPSIAGASTTDWQGQDTELARMFWKGYWQGRNEVPLAGVTAWRPVTANRPVLKGIAVDEDPPEESPYKEIAGVTSFQETGAERTQRIRMLTQQKLRTAMSERVEDSMAKE